MAGSASGLSQDNMRTRDSETQIPMTDLVPRGKSNGSRVKPVLRVLQFAALTTAIAVASPAFAVTDIQWWHAMSGQLGKQLEKLAADFNASQFDYRIGPTDKGNYTQT